MVYSCHSEIFSFFFFWIKGSPALGGELVTVHTYVGCKQTFGMSQSCQPEKEQALHCCFFIFIFSNQTLGGCSTFEIKKKKTKKTGTAWVNECISNPQACLCCKRVRLVFWGSWVTFCLASVLLWRLCCTGRCDFCMQASTVGVLQQMLKNPQDQSCSALKSPETRANSRRFVLLFSTWCIWFF